MEPSPAAVDLLFMMAGYKLQMRCRVDVRVVPTHTWLDWLQWAGNTGTPNLGRLGTLPPTLERGVLRGADFVLIPWYQAGYYCALFISNLRTPFPQLAPHGHAESPDCHFPFLMAPTCCY